MILLLRPQHKLQASVDYFTTRQCPAAGLALLSVASDPQQIARLNSALAAQPDLLLFTSRVAAELFVSQHPKLPAHCQVLSIGPASAAPLQQAGIQVVYPGHHTSEGLLALPQLSQIQGKSIILCKGHGGRGVLVPQLTQLGAKVQELNLYRREPLSPPVTIGNWHPQQIRCIIATSGEQIDAAFATLDTDWLRQPDWIVVSPRTGEIAASYGITRYYISHSADDAALYQCLSEKVTRA